jgi:phosphatidylinositol alpha-1,6-mannosyltransferase
MHQGLRVLFVARAYPPTTGGMERFAKDVHDALEAEVQLRSLTWGGSKLALPLVLPYFFVRSLVWLAAGRIDVIHAQDGVVSILLTPLAWLFRKPILVVIHGLDVTYKLGLYQWLIRWSLGRAAAIAAISTAARQEVIKRGISEDTIQIVPVGITDDFFYDDKTKARQAVRKLVPELVSGLGQRKILLANGRLVERKGLAWFVTNVLPAILAVEPDTVLLISGEGPMRPAIEAAIAQQNLHQAVYLLGRTSNTQLKDLYNAADCFVMPNLPVAGDIEGFGRVLLEAALCEVPVVASGIEGIVDAIVDGKNGHLVPTGQATKHAQVILRVLGDTGQGHRKDRFGRRARTYTLANYGWPHIVTLYTALYQTIVREKA